MRFETIMLFMVDSDKGPHDIGEDGPEIAAGIIALFLGGLGAHKFYTNQYKQGVIYLLFFWTGIPELLGIIEGILLIFKGRDLF